MTEEDEDLHRLNREELLQKFIASEQVSLDKSTIAQLIILISKQGIYNQRLLHALMKSVVDEIKFEDFEEVVKVGKSIDDALYDFIQGLTDSEGKSE